jgi:hypothetical protein
MRQKFPFFWLVQVMLFGGAGVVCLFFPMTLLQIQHGELAPVEVARPDVELREWVLGLESIEPPPETVKSLLMSNASPRTTEGTAAEDLHEGWLQLKIIIDFSKRPKDDLAADRDLFSPEEKSEQWEAVKSWLLSATPAPPGQAIHKWLNAIDELPQPSASLAEWIARQTEPQNPPRELRKFILAAKQSGPISWRLAAQQLRLTASPLLAASLFTILGLISPSIRRPLARIFVLIAMFWTGARLWNSLNNMDTILAYGLVYCGLVAAFFLVCTAVRAAQRLKAGSMLWALLALWWMATVILSINNKHDTGGVVVKIEMSVMNILTAVVGLFNAWYWLIGKNEDPPQDDAGIAQHRAPQLWTLWLIQFVVLMMLGVLTLLMPEKMAEMFAEDHHDYLTVDVVNDAVRLLGVSVIAMSLFSYFALGVATDWIWQGIGRIFIALFVMFALTSLINGRYGDYSIWGYTYGFLGLLFVPATRTLLKSRDNWATENVENQRQDCTIPELLVALRMLKRPLFLGQRFLYRTGVGAMGKFTAQLRNNEPSGIADRVDSLGIPENQFFAEGRKFRVEVRFSNCFQDDDAGLDIRGCGLRLRAIGTDESMDMYLATGAFSPARSLQAVRHLTHSGNLQKEIPTDSVLRDGLAAGMRRAPESFGCLSYYQQIVLEWLTPEAKHHLVRFRLVPQLEEAPIAAARGVPDHEDLEHLWKMTRRPTETRAANYLRSALIKQLSRGGTVSFQLQAQFHTPQADDSTDWFDASLDWDECACPWHSLGTVELDTPMEAEASDALWFNPACIPSAIRVPQPENITNLDDPRSLAAAQIHVARLLGWIRAWRRRPAVGGV